MSDESLTINGRSVSRWPAVHAKTKRSRTQAWRDIRAGVFPAPIKTGPNSIAWFDDEIDGWLNSRPRVQYANTSDPGPEAGAA